MSTRYQNSVEGHLIKLKAQIPSLVDQDDFVQPSLMQIDLNAEVNYHLRLIQQPSPDFAPYAPQNLKHELVLNDLVGQELSIEFLKKINCIYCGRKIRKTYSDGYCYQCFIEQPTAAECVIRPALCQAHLGGGRDPEWEQVNHMVPHYVYLALSSKLKVGVTRDWPTRWLDQGADAIKVIACTPYRQLAGLIELELAQHYSDKLSWQGMLKGNIIEGVDLHQEAQRCKDLLSNELIQYLTPNSALLSLKYPINEYPSKVKSTKLDKQDELSGTLMGVKGQYLIFDQNRVINMRSHSAYQVRINY